MFDQTRVMPEQITLNIGADADIPEPPEGHTWGKVQHDNTVVSFKLAFLCVEMTLGSQSWMAMWKENINNAFKYVFLAAGSSLKGKSDFMKFEKARKLKVR
jgi:DNA topoisomerase-1